jgi:hypothetical protein
MRSFARYFILLLLALAALSVYLPLHYGEPYPRQPGPTFDNAVRNRHTLIIEENHVEVVLVGDSVLEQGVDPMALSAALEMPSYAIAVPGSKSAFWYLILKNIVLEAQNRPDYFIIVFRDSMLTLPNYHVNGGYVTELDPFATAHEDFLLEHAYLNFMNPLEKWGLAYFPLYSSRQRLTDTADYYARNTLPGLLLSCNNDCAERAMATAHHVTNVREEFRVEALVGDEALLFTRDAMDFKGSVDSSFLPEIIRLARENGIRLIFVHARTLQFPSAAAEPSALQEYKRLLSAYLEANHVPLLDFSHDPRLPEEYFTDLLHMNETGKAAFTQILAEALKALFAGEAQ